MWKRQRRRVSKTSASVIAPLFSNVDLAHSFAFLRLLGMRRSQGHPAEGMEGGHNFVAESALAPQEVEQQAVCAMRQDPRRCGGGYDGLPTPPKAIAKGHLSARGDVQFGHSAHRTHTCGLHAVTACAHRPAFHTIFSPTPRTRNLEGLLRSAGISLERFQDCAHDLLRLGPGSQLRLRAE